MVRKILKYFLRFVLVIVGLLVLLSILVYVPPIQNFIKNKAAEYVSDNMGIGLDIERLSLRFPLTLTVDNTVLTTAEGDTMLSVGRVRAAVSLLPLLTGNVEVSSFGLERTTVNYSDSTGGMALRGTLAKVGLDNVRVHFGDSRIELAEISLAGADLQLDLGETTQPTQPADTTASDTIPWKFVARRAGFDNIKFTMRTSPEISVMMADLGRGDIRELSADLAEQRIDVELLRVGGLDFSYLTDTVAVDAPQADTLPAVESRPWEVHAGRIELADGGVTYGTIYGRPAAGFDPSYIQAAGIGIEVDSVAYRGADISAVIASLALRERSGLEIRSTEGRFAMADGALALEGFKLATANSTLSANAVAGSAAASIMEMSPGAPVRAAVDAVVGVQDLFLFSPPDDAMRSALAGKSLTFKGDIAGTLGGRIDISRLHAEVPGHIVFDAKGDVHSVTAPENLAANLTLDGRFSDLGFVTQMLPDTALRQRIGFPEHLALAGTVAIDRDAYAPDLRITADSGRLDVKGRFDLAAQTYDAVVAADAFPLHTFLPADSLGLLTLDLTARGNGFDFEDSATEADIDLAVRRFDYGGYDFHDITFDATYAANKLAGRLASDSRALALDLTLGGGMTPERYAAGIRGRISRADAAAMGFSETPLALATSLDVQVSAARDTTQYIYAANAVFESMRLTHGANTENIGRTTLTASSDRRETKTALRSGDLSLDFVSGASLDRFLEQIEAAGAEIMAQLDGRNVQAAQIEAALPPFSLDIAAGRDNVLHSLMREQDMDFERITLTGASGGEKPFTVRGLVTGFRTGDLRMDTLNMGVGNRNDKLTYFVRMANRPGNLDEFGLIYAYGTMQGDSVQLNLNQRNREGVKGFVFGLKAVLQDSAVRVSLFPENPLFGYETWSVNSGNFFEYRFNNEMYGNLELVNGKSHIKISSVEYHNMPPGSVRVDISELNIAHTLDLLPAPPPVGGQLGANLALGLGNNIIAANGSVRIGNLIYDKQRVGDIAATVIMNTDKAGVWNIDTSLTVDDATALTAQGTYDMPGTDALNITATIPSLPLAAVNAFMPPEYARLSGGLQGNARIRGTAAAPQINGSLSFTDGRLTVPMIGTTFGIAPQPIAIRNNRMRLTDFGLTSPNKQQLFVDGTVDIGDFSNMTAALAIAGTNFQVINAQRRRDSPIHGLAEVDVKLNASGPVDALKMRGDVTLLRTTNVYYTMDDSPMDVESEKQDIVTFISFSDSTAMAAQDSLVKVSTGGMDIQINVNIDDDVEATVNLSSDGENRLELIGGGNLTFTMNDQGDMRLTGRYTLSGGTVVYTLPLIPKINFAAESGSYVEWVGDPTAPEFHITATDVAKATVKNDEGERRVNFDVHIDVGGSLESMQLLFDLSAPTDGQIQNELAAMAPEQRSVKAITILTLGVYDIGDIKDMFSSGGSGATGLLTSFVTSEINKWARNSLPGVDFSIGTENIDTGNSTHTNYSYSVSKSLFNDRMRVTVGGSMSDAESAGQNMRDNFFGDVSIEYRLAKRDNMFLKAYRHSIEDMLDGEIVETGGGFLVRRKMEKLNELFRITPDPEKREAREIQRRYRRELRDEELRVERDTSRRYNPDLPDSVLQRRRAMRDSLRQADPESYNRWRESRDSVRRARGMSPAPSMLDDAPQRDSSNNANSEQRVSPAATDPRQPRDRDRDHDTALSPRQAAPQKRDDEPEL